MSFRQRLKQQRELLNLKQSEVADKLKIHRSTLNHYESGSRSPDFDTLVALARELKCTTDYLLTGDKGLNGFSQLPASDRGLVKVIVNHLVNLRNK